MTTRRRGRPTAYNEQVHKDICRDLELGSSRTTAAEANGITLGTLNEWAGQPPDWQGKFPEFSRDVRAAIGKAKRRASTTITKAIQSGDVQSAFRYLAYQEREWRDPTPSVNVNHSGTINQRDLTAFTDEQIERLADVAEQVQSGALVP